MAFRGFFINTASRNAKKKEIINAHVREESLDRDGKLHSKVHQRNVVLSKVPHSLR
jgi:hypothetical protein